MTGGGGFIGSHLTRALLRSGYSVHLLWKKSSNVWRLKDIKKKIVFHGVDIFNRADLERLFIKINPYAIFHLATFGQYRNQDDAGDIIKTSVLGTLTLLQASKEVPYSIFVNTGSSSEYGFNDKPMREEDLPKPISFYAVSKVSATYLCQVFSQTYKKPIVTVRPFSVYGPMEEETRFIPTIIKSLIENKPIRLTSGTKRRDFIYVEDVVKAYIKILNKHNRLSGEIFNLGTGVEYSNDEVVKTLFKIAGRKVPIEKGAFPQRIWDSNHWVADTSKSSKKLRWKAQYSLREGLKKTYEHYTGTREK